MTIRLARAWCPGFVLLASILTACATGQPPAERAAPDFTLLDQADRQVRLSDFKGKKNVVLVFYWNHG